MEYKGYTISIEQDSMAGNPREEFDCAGHMVCFHRRYNIGDKHNFSMEEARAITMRKDVFYLSIYMIDHSGISLSARHADFMAADPRGWDWGPVGFIYMDRAEVLNNFMVKRITPAIKEKVYDLLLSEVKIYSAWLEGDVYGYVIKDPAGNDIDSCWGFYGEYGYCMDEAKRIVDWHVDEAKRLKTPPVEYMASI